MRTPSLLLFLFLIGIGCRPSVDAERPEMDISSPVGNDIVTTDDGIRLLATLMDNTGLLQYKITISGIDSLNDVGRDSTLKLVLIDGIPKKPTWFQLDKAIELADTTFNGHYILTLSCVDAEGNESRADTVRIRIKNSIDPDPPVFNVAGPTTDTLVYGQGFSLTGTVTDSRSLIFSDIFIGTTNFSDTVLYVSFPWITNNTIDYTNDWNWWTQVDSSWAQGQYHVFYTAWDNYSGVSHTIPFYVKY